MTRIESQTSILRTHLEAVRGRIARAASAAGRGGQVSLLPVTKAVSIEVASALVSLGQSDLAENRAEGLEAKAAAIEGVRWHFIGHLQRNKARRVVRHATVIHSVDSPRLVETLARLAAEDQRSLQIYMEVGFTEDETKHGMDEQTLDAALDAAAASPDLEVLGLMAMAPRLERPGHDAATVFGRTANVSAKIRAQRPGVLGPGLSMGMSSDLEAAVAAGSTCVRIGRDLYRGLSA